MAARKRERRSGKGRVDARTRAKRSKKTTRRRSTKRAAKSRARARGASDLALERVATADAVPGLNVVVDLSHHNNAVDFSKVKADGIVGVIYKATQGASYVDPTYATRRAGALKERLRWGAYHFGTGGDGEAQAKHFLDVVQPDSKTLMALDFEQDPQGPDMTLDQARAFVTRIFTETGRFPGIYGGHYLKQLLGTTPDAVLGQCWLWLSQYGLRPTVPNTWTRWTIWQYTDGAAGPEPHTVAGIGRCDRDTFEGDLADLRVFWKA